jgi:NTP pyrophosphatase (non-canonical NTP hydrolase)
MISDEEIEARTEQQRRVTEWNERYPIGTPVTLRLDDGSTVDTTTRSEAWVLSSDRAVVKVEGRTGGYALERVQPRVGGSVTGQLRELLRPWAYGQETFVTAVTRLIEERDKYDRLCVEQDEALKLVRTDTANVWRWQGDGNDDPASLVCPVIMSAQTLNEIVAPNKEGLAAIRDLQEQLKGADESAVAFVKEFQRLQRELAEANTKAEEHWNAYCGANGRLKAAQDRERVAHEHRELAEKELSETKARLRDAVYKERDQCVALIARMALGLGYRVWLGQHPNADWEDDWRTIVFIDLPTGQVSWHIHDSEREWFLRDLHYNSDLIWDGHDTAEKYHRVLEYRPPTNAPAKLSEYLERLITQVLRVYTTQDVGGECYEPFLEEMHQEALAAQHALATLPKPELGNFALLRSKSVPRCEQVFFPIKDWSVTDWACALAGEVGEVCDAAKKLKRGDGSVQDIADELADVLTYADLLAASLEIDLWAALCHKFNIVSNRWKSPIRLPEGEEQ